MWIESATIAVGLSLYSFVVEPRWFRLRRKSVRLRGSLRRPLEILHLSDFHYHGSCRYRSRFLKRLAAESVDFIFLTGDLIDVDAGIDPCLEALQHFSPRYGFYAVLGNHDYLRVTGMDLMRPTGVLPKEKNRRPNDVERLKAGLRRLGIVVMRNERHIVEVEGIPVTVAGVDDPYLERDDLPATFQGFVKQGPCFVLVHAPERHLEISELGADMVFSGHTHGGQVCLPFLGPIITRTTAPRRFAFGLTRENGTLFHTTRGIGTGLLSRPRFLCPPEAVVFSAHFTEDENRLEPPLVPDPTDCLRNPSKSLNPTNFK